jgi:hypothetical protein
MESHHILLRSLLVFLREQFWVLFFFWYRLIRGSIKVFLETITIFLGFDSFVDDAVVGEQSELAGFHIF